VERWFGRIFCLLPDFSFKVKRIVVSGFSWNTTAIAEWQRQVRCSIRLDKVSLDY
jgi:hypothetical protein